VATSLWVITHQTVKELLWAEGKRKGETAIQAHLNVGRIGYKMDTPFSKHKENQAIKKGQRISNPASLLSGSGDSSRGLKP